MRPDATPRSLYIMQLSIHAALVYRIHCISEPSPSTLPLSQLLDAVSDSSKMALGNNARQSCCPSRCMFMNIFDTASLEDAIEALSLDRTTTQ